MRFFVRERAFYRTFFSLTAMIAVQNIITFSVNLADNLMLGAYQENALAGVALVNQIQYLLQMLVMGVGEGMIVLASQYWGKGEVEPIRRITGLGMRIGFLTAVAMWGVTFFFPEACLGLFTNEKAVIAEGARYLRIVCFSYPLFAVTNVLLSSLRSVETVGIGFAVSGSTLCINVCLNTILITGRFGAPELGARGAAVATLTSRAVEVLIVWLYVRLKDKKLRLRAGDLFRFDRALWRDYRRTGFPVILSNGCWGIAMAVQTAILGRLGKPVISANSIATTLFQVITVIAYGAASASSILVGKTIGEGGTQRVREYAETLQVLYLLIGLGTGLLLFFSKEAVVDLYAVSEETRRLALQFLTVLSVSVCGTSYQVAVLTGIVRGGGDTRFVLFNDMIFMWGLVIPSAALSAFVFHFPPLIVFCCLKADQILKCFVAVVKVNRYTWIRELAR